MAVRPARSDRRNASALYAARRNDRPLSQLRHPHPDHEDAIRQSRGASARRKKIFHHANILIDRTGGSRRRDEQDPEVGFGGMDVAIESESFDPDSHFLFWKPGSAPWVEPEAMAWPATPGTDLVLNLHMQPSGKPETIKARIGLYFTDSAPSKFPMLLQLEHDGAIDIPPGKKDFVITDEFTLPVDVDALAVYPHAHYVGKDL